MTKTASEHLESGNEIDLADLNGDVKHLLDNKDQFAINLVKERETYVLIKVDRKTADSKPVYAPILISEKIAIEDFINKLNSVKKNKAFNPKGVVKNKQQAPPLGTIKKKSSIVTQISTIDDASPTPGEKE